MEAGRAHRAAGEAVSEQLDLFSEPPSNLPPVIGEEQPWPGRRQLHQHSPEILALPTASPWKRISDLHLTGCLAVVGTIHWEKTDREVQVYQITRKGLMMLLAFIRGEHAKTRRLARKDDVATAIVSGKLTVEQTTRPGGLLHQMLEVFAR